MNETTLLAFFCVIIDSSGNFSAHLHPVLLSIKSLEKRLRKNICETVAILLKTLIAQFLALAITSCRCSMDVISTAREFSSFRKWTLPSTSHANRNSSPFNLIASRRISQLAAVRLLRRMTLLWYEVHFSALGIKKHSRKIMLFAATTHKTNFQFYRDN